MVDSYVWTLVIVTSIISIWNIRQVPLLSFANFVTLVFFIFVVSKTILYHYYGSSIFLAHDIDFLQEQVNTAIIAICLFVLGIILSYHIPIYKPAWKPNRKYLIELNLTKVNNITLYIILPLFIIFFLIFIFSIYYVGGEVFHKTGQYFHGNISPAYFMQKFAQIIKISVYLYMFQFILLKNKLNKNKPPFKSLLLFGISITLTTLVFLVSGHRSGIIILFLQIILFMQYLGWIQGRHLLIAITLLIALNLFILLFRESTDTSSFYIINILRRYFFEIEKISGIIYILDPSGHQVHSFWSILTLSPLDTIPQENIHYFLGHKVLHSDSAVGPSVLGEIILYLGCSFIFPIALMIGYIVRVIENTVANTTDPIKVVIGITLVALSEFLLLNTDSIAFIKRFIFEFILIFWAIFLLKYYTKLEAFVKIWQR